MSKDTKKSTPATTNTLSDLVPTPGEAEKSLAELGAYEEFAGAGFEGQTADDYSIPFIAILQSNSKAVETNSELRAGMIYNTVTGEAFDAKTGICFVPATTQHLFVEWKPRAQGGGFVGIHQPNSEVVAVAKAASKEFGKYSSRDGNDLIETFYVYGTALDSEGNPFQAVLSFSSTNIKRYKGWMTKAKTIQIVLPNGRRIPAPLFAHRYVLKTVMSKNTKGTFHNWDISFDGPDAPSARLLPSDPLFQASVAVKQVIESGQARVSHESQGPASEEGTPAVGDNGSVF